MAESLIGAQNAFKTNVNNINVQQQSSNNKAYESVAVQPDAWCCTTTSCNDTRSFTIESDGWSWWCCCWWLLNI